MVAEGPALSKAPQASSEGLGFARLVMVLSSFAPLFGLMALRGSGCVFPQAYLAACLTLAVLPSVGLWYRCRVAIKNKDVKNLKTGKTEDQRSHLLVYLFATLLPFYRDEIGSVQELVAMCAALGFIVFLFWRLNLHYLNLIFAIFRYQVFTVFPPDDGNPHTGKENFVIITRRKTLLEGVDLSAYRLSNTVYWEKA